MEEKDIQNQNTDNLSNTPSQDGTHKKHIKLSPKFIKVFLMIFVPIILLAGLFTYSKIQSLNKENVSLQKELDNTKKQYQEAQVDLTRREQETPHIYKRWDELRLTRCFLDFRILLYYNVFTNQSYLTERI